MSEYNEIFQPLLGLFTQSQIHTILLAWLPVKFGPYMTGIMAVDMFLTSVIASGVSTFALALYKFISSFTFGNPWKKEGNVTVQVQYYTEGTYGDLYASIFYEALSWLISQQTKDLDKGSFVVQHSNTSDNNDDDECAPPTFNILPEKNQKITIEFKGKKFEVSFNMPEQEKKEESSNSYRYSRNKPKPSIFLTILDEECGTNVDSMNEFLSEVTRAYLEAQKKTKVRSRYERNGSYWYHIQSLSSIRGLDTVALDQPQELLLKKELDTFISDKDFYGRIGMPYRRGIILYGRPGTGKTSLINAISSHLSRDIYYLNLKAIMDDNELSAAFSSVPANQIIVLEDVDTQSKILHKRTRKESLFVTAIESTGDKKEEVGPSMPAFSKFSLSTFLGCLDGNILAEGNIIIMTTNHIEHLDPACIRPGRMDVHLDLGYCTHYQIRKMYKSVVEDPEAEFPKDILEKIPEKMLPPCEVMMTMVLYRNEIDVIPEKIYELVAKYKDMKPEEIAKQMEEEALRISEASAEGEKEENKEEVKDENKEEVKEEVKDENKEEVKEEVKDENKEEVKDETKEEAKDETKEEIKDESKEVKVEEKEETKDENKEIKDERKEEIKDDNKEVKEKREEIKDENKDEIKDEDKEEVKEKREEIKEGENKTEINKEEKKEEEIIKREEVIKEEIIKSEEINKNETTNEEEEDSDSTDVEAENDKIKNVKVFETSTTTSQVLAVTS